MRNALWSVLFATAAAACGDSISDTLPDAPVEPPPIDAPVRPSPSVDFTRDIVATDLALDLATRTGRATIELLPSTSTGAGFSVGDLEILAVHDAIGPLQHAVAEGVLAVGVPPSSTSIVVEYRFSAHVGSFDGFDPEAGNTFLWPTFCGNLYPCKPGPADGQRFTLAVTGAPDGAQLVYPRSIPAQAPSYMPALAVGAYTERTLGTTAGGTTVKAWHLPGEEAATTAGTAKLVDMFQFFEQTYGPYPFGSVVGSVSANWGPGAYGGMEHHPYWHVAQEAMGNPMVHAHEAAHGWFGNGVRLACWEDLTLSEGVATYAAARALAATGQDIWPEYDCALADVCADGGGTIAMPETCNEIDLLTHPLWSMVPYQKGAQFLREVATVIGEVQLDAALAQFYSTHREKAARMADLVDALKAAAPTQSAQIATLADGWLSSEACPTQITCTLGKSERRAPAWFHHGAR